MGFSPLYQHCPHNGGGYWVWPPGGFSPGSFLPAASHRGALRTHPRGVVARAHVLLSGWNFQVRSHQSILPLKPVSS